MNKRTFVAVALLALLIAQVNAAFAMPLFKLADAINWLMVHSVDPFSKFDWATFRLPEYSGRAALIYAVVFLTPWLILAWVLWRIVRWGRRRRAASGKVPTSGGTPGGPA